MSQARLHDNLKTGIWPEFTATVTKIEKIMMKLNEEKCSHEKFYSKITE